MLLIHQNTNLLKKYLDIPCLHWTVKSSETTGNEEAEMETKATLQNTHLKYLETLTIFHKYSKFVFTDVLISEFTSNKNSSRAFRCGCLKGPTSHIQNQEERWS